MKKYLEHIMAPALCKRVLGCLLALCLCASMSAQTLYVGNNSVPAENYGDILNDGGSMSYDPQTQTLTLNNATYIPEYSAIIESTWGIKHIRLIGKNKIACKDLSLMKFKQKGGQDVTISGQTPDAKLTVSRLFFSLYDPMNWDEGSANLTIKDCTLDVYDLSLANGQLKIDNANLIVRNAPVKGCTDVALGPGVRFMQPHDAFYDKQLASITQDGKEAYEGKLSIGLPSQQILYENAFVIH